MRLILICLTLFFVPHYLLYAQKAKYSRVALGNQVRIVGAVGNSIHAWSISKESKKIFKVNNLLTLHIFSPGLDLIDEKILSFGESIITKFDFQMEDHFYYINILYNAGINKRLMLKIDPAGNTTDVTTATGLLTKTNLLSGLQYAGSVTANTNNFFDVKISPGDAADSNLVTANLPPEEKFTDNQTYEKLTVRKISDERQLVAEKVYASGYLNFSRLLITSTDSTVYVCAFAQSKTGQSKNPYKGSYLFLTRLDANLAGVGNGPLLLKNKKWSSKEIFSPNDIFLLDKNILVIGTGLYNKTTYAYYRDSRTGITSYIPQVFNSYVPVSVMITMADEHNNRLMDTVIKIKEGREHLQWENRFVLLKDNEVRLFCSHRYTASKAGITLLTVNQSGKITERDLIVNENYSYALRQAISLEHGVLLVPFRYKRKTGLMKLAYETTE